VLCMDAPDHYSGAELTTQLNYTAESTLFAGVLWPKHSNHHS
jgi:hypothetical protein